MFITALFFYYLKNILTIKDKTIKENVFEVRLRVGQPLQIILEKECLFVRYDSSVTTDYKNCGYYLSKNDITDSLNKLCDYSLHTHLEEIQNGFVTIKGGHRVGICGTAVVKENKIYKYDARTELHLHTNMSAFDGVNSAAEYLQEGLNLSMPAMAITDHASIQAYPEAYRFVKRNGFDIKLIYGVDIFIKSDSERFPVTILVKNKKGLFSILHGSVKIASISF